MTHGHEELEAPPAAETRVLACCATKAQGKRIADLLEPIGCSVTTLHGSGLRDAINDLRSHAEDLRVDADQPMAGFHVVVVLDDLNVVAPGLSGDSFIPTLRAFTDVGRIVLAEASGAFDFDLTDIFGRKDRMADLELATLDHISCPKLWGVPLDGGFAPWHWRSLPDWARRRRLQADVLSNALHAPALEAIGLPFPQKAAETLSRRAIGRMNPYARREDAAAGTSAMMMFRLDNRSVGVRMKLRLENGHNDGDPSASLAIARLAAFRLEEWLHRDVLWPGETLIDLPHLIDRYSHALGEAQAAAESWLAALDGSDAPPYGMDGALYRQCIEPAEIRSPLWLPGPCFWRTFVDASDVLRDAFFDGPGRGPIVYCEDTSRFEVVDLDRRIGELPVRYIPDLPTLEMFRFAALLGTDGLKYGPLVRLFDKRKAA